MRCRLGWAAPSFYIYIFPFFAIPNGYWYCSVFLTCLFCSFMLLPCSSSIVSWIFTCLHSIGWMVYLLLLELCLLSLLYSLLSSLIHYSPQDFIFISFFSLHQTPGTSLISKGFIAGLRQSVYLLKIYITFAYIFFSDKISFLMFSKGSIVMQSWHVFWMFCNLELWLILLLELQTHLSNRRFYCTMYRMELTSFLTKPLPVSLISVKSTIISSGVPVRNLNIT